VAQPPEIQDGCHLVILSSINPKIERIFLIAAVRNSKTFHISCLKTVSVILLTTKWADSYCQKQYLFGGDN